MNYYSKVKIEDVKFTFNAKDKKFSFIFNESIRNFLFCEIDNFLEKNPLNSLRHPSIKNFDDIYNFSNTLSKLFYSNVIFSCRVEFIAAEVIGFNVEIRPDKTQMPKIILFIDKKYKKFIIFPDYDNYVIEC